jgi:hypothetical protein
MFGKPQMTDLSAEKQAEKAIAHTLINIAERPGVAWYLGHGTQTYSLLTESLATLSGKGMDEIQNIYPPADQPSYDQNNRRACPFCDSNGSDLESDDDEHFFKCLDCKATGPRVEEWHYDSKADAIAAAARKWNEFKMPR